MLWAQQHDYVHIILYYRSVKSRRKQWYVSTALHRYLTLYSAVCLCGLDVTCVGVPRKVFASSDFSGFIYWTVLLPS